MPAPIIAEQVAAHAAARDLGRRITPVHAAALALILAIAAGLVLVGMRRSAGGIKVPAAQTEDKPGAYVPPPGYPVVSVYGHVGQVVNTPHRYPRVCGGELSAVINGGHATLRLPHQRDLNWLTQPPSEVVL